MESKVLFMISKNLQMSNLLDCYEAVLTDNQKEVMDFYYNEDLSLSEIAENQGITRQAVRDTIKRAETQLIDFEKKLKVLSKQKKLTKMADDIFKLAEKISNSGEVNSKKFALEIINIANSIKQLL